MWWANIVKFEVHLDEMAITSAIILRVPSSVQWFSWQSKNEYPKKSQPENIMHALFTT